jgi:hypothetical protein
VEVLDALFDSSGRGRGKVPAHDATALGQAADRVAALLRHLEIRIQGNGGGDAVL